MYDLAIIGAGPAGATLARLVGGRYRVLLIDRRDFRGVSAADPGSTRAGKCCGGLLAPDAQRMLSELGLGLPKSVLEGPQLFVVKAIDTEQGLARHYQRHYINMDRLRFDAWLVSMVPSTVDVRLGCGLRSWTAQGGHAVLTLDQGGRRLVEEARVLVGADGASSRVRLGLAPGVPSPRRYLAIQEWVEGDGGLPYFTSIFDRRITDYYSWTIPKGDALLIGAALPLGRDAAVRFRLLKQLLRENGIQVGRTLRRESALVFRPTAPAHVCAVHDGVAFVGEAGGWISPSSAEGISHAFRSARALAEALAPSLDGFERRYRNHMRSVRRDLLLKMAKSRALFNPALRATVMRLGLNTVKPYLPAPGE